MKGFQVLVILTLILSSGVAPWGISEGLAQVESLIVVDATGKTLGPVLDAVGPGDSLPTVPFKIGNSIFTLAVASTRFLPPNGQPNSLYFNSAGCNGLTGQAVAVITDLQPLNIILWSFVGADGGTVYGPTPNSQPIQSFTALSKLKVQRPPLAVVCEDLTSPIVTGPAVPAMPIVNMLTLFTPPFSVQATVTRAGPKK